MQQYSYRRYLIAVPLILCALAATIATPPQAKAERTRDARPAEQQQTSPAQPNIVVHVDYPKKSEQELADEKHDREEKAKSDIELVKLTADLAKFTQWLAYATIALVVATVGLIVMGILQSRDMKESIAQAERSANIANDSLTKLERALVYCSEQIFESPPSMLDPTSTCVVQLVFTNTGKTWTKYGRTFHNWQSFATEMPATFEFNDFAGEPGTTFIGPGGTAIIGPALIPTEVIWAALDRRVHLYVWAWFEYDDIFEGTPRHRTEFCVKIEPLRNPYLNADGTGSVPIGFKIHRAFNGADEDCTKRIQTGSPKNPLAAKV